MNITYHMVPRKYFETCDPGQDYLPADFPKDGFIHCTDGEFMVSNVANFHFKGLSDDLLVLYIDKTRVKSPIRYDDGEKLFPHIYGPLNRDAIVRFGKMVRDRKGDWIFPISEVSRSGFETS